MTRISSQYKNTQSSAKNNRAQSLATDSTPKIKDQRTHNEQPPGTHNKMSVPENTPPQKKAK